ncbi:MAG: CYTH domain-containing protein [Candidatus Woesearchaeota archaeon]
MKEIEVKIIEIDKDEIIKKLLDLGAEKVFEGNIYAVHYDFKDNSLKIGKSFVRLRKRGDKSFLAYKKKISKDKAKVMEEIETEVSDFDDTHNILLSIGLIPYLDYNKKRTSYKFKKILFEIDEYEDIPPLLEIEAPSVEIIDEMVKKLRLDKEKVKNWTGRDLYENYGKKFSYTGDKNETNPNQAW